MRATHELELLEPGHLGLYVCGATVQGAPHIGHLRTSLAFDLLVRWARRSGLKVTYIRNITDIDDKILAKSAAAGRPWWAHAALYEREFEAAYRALHLVEPTFEPRATAHISDQIALIDLLINNGHAYQASPGNVYFNVHSLPDYGSLTRQRLADLQHTEDEAQVDAQAQSEKRDPRDFALWKAAKPGEPDNAAWDSPWGRGRPGWHLECSAMSRRYLGESFDIHGGGLDLRFPHHENEQAQSHGAGWGFARHWMHTAWVTVKGEKMSKSLGNSLVVSQLLSEVSAPVLRCALITTHYRQALEFSQDSLAVAQGLWEKFTSFTARAQASGLLSTQVLAATAGPGTGEVIGQPQRPPASAADNQAQRPAERPVNLSTLELPAGFVAAMDEDLNVAGALAFVHAAVKEGNAALAAGDQAALETNYLQLRAMLEVLGLDPQAWQTDLDQSPTDTSAGAALSQLMQTILQERARARAEKNWARADEIRQQLSEAGITVEDGASGASWHL